MRVARSGDGVRLRLNIAEAHVLERLFAELGGVLDPSALPEDDPVRRRLYPAGYEDDGDAAAFRELTESGLQQERSERVERCAAELAAARSLVRTELLLDADATQRWLQVLNDMRLAFGTRLGITEDDEVHGADDLDQADPQVRLRASYLWLTALQDTIVVTVMGD